jgi:hypothetical protein
MMMFPEFGWVQTAGQPHSPNSEAKREQEQARNAACEGAF